MNRRDLLRWLSIGLGNCMGLALAIPGVGYLLDPLFRKKTGGGAFTSVAKLSDLAAGVPRAFPVIAERRDAWVQYEPEPVGLVWLIRQGGAEKGGEPGSEVVAFTAECPHLGCAINLAASGKSFLCPCHTSSFDFSGKPLNAVPPRGMDALEVKLSEGSNPEILVKFERFRTMSKEKTPLG